MTTPASHLTPPIPVEPYPPEVDYILNLPDIVSGSYLFGEFCELINLPPSSEIAEYFGGDWEAVARAADACRKLGRFHRALAADMDSEFGPVAASWNGVAATDATRYFGEFSAQLTSNAYAFDQVADQLDQTVIGVYEGVRAIKVALDMVLDAAIQFGLTAAYLLGTAWAPGPGPAATAIGSVRLVALIKQGVELVGKILETHTTAVSLCSAAVGAIATPMATARGITDMHVPAPYSNVVVPR